MAKDKCVLAYSGGLDTSVCIKWLQDEKNLDVIAVVGEVGQEHEGLEQVKQRALETGAIDCIIADMREDFAADYLSKALYANANFENKYPLVSALSRPLISKYLVDTAHKYGAKYVAHGCTGKGNDQVRFETSIQALDPTLEIIAPVREWDMHTRQEEMDWAEAHGVTVPTTKSKPYSIDDNLWGRAIECGALEDPWAEPPADIWVMTTDPAVCPDVPESVVVGFEAGRPCSLDGVEMTPRAVIEKLNEIAGRNGYGRLDLIENRLVGIKSRECYEVPGALSLITAHKALEDLCLERDLLHYKLDVEHKWSELVYNGLWFSPLKLALDAFFESTQASVTGEVRLQFFKGCCTVVGRRSDHSLYDYNLATYDEGDTFDRDSAAGFIFQWGLPSKVWAKQRKSTGTEGQI